MNDVDAMATGGAFAVVEQLAGERATGVLRGPTGTLHLADGLVVHAESDRAPDLATLLTRCGRITREAWQEAVRSFGPHGRVGGALVEQRLLTRGELEVCQLGVLYDAAFFVLGATGTPAGPWSFEPGVRHWLGPVAAVSARRLRREVERRHRLLERIWPWPQLDTTPVRPADTVGPVRPGGAQERCAAPGTRVGGRPCPPSRRQRELLDHADGRRTPAELARLLGRSAFATTADVRRLAAAGLLATPVRGAPRHAAWAAAAAGRAMAAGTSGGARPGPQPEPRPGPQPGARPAPQSEPQSEPRAGARPGPQSEPRPGPVPGLHRRVPGAALAALLPAGAARSAHHRPSTALVHAPPLAHPPAPVHPPGPAAAHPLTVPDPDIALLTRVRILLEARL
ncbi:hypothetical protein OG535_33820 [Kitasatospora sp. NBC_00085]|uniref:hypothetical protein n=1 Tax=unclassified Kitasatospora TaxID=2633591 RepID=UPI0032432222